MQTINKTLKINGSKGDWINLEDGSTDVTPEIGIGVQTRLKIDLRSNEKEDDLVTYKPVNFEEFDCDSFYIAMDSDYLKETDPKLFKNNGITITQDVVTGVVTLECELPNTANPRLLDAVKASESVTLTAELGGIMSGSDATTANFAIRFKVNLTNRVWLGDEVPEDIVDDPRYWDSTQIIAYVGGYFKPTKGDPGKDGEDGDDGKDAYTIAVEQGFDGTEDEWLATLQGPAGQTAYELAVEQGFDGNEDDWLQSLIGEGGRSAYQIAVDAGFEGSITEWLESLKGKDGATGDDLHFDAIGSLDELQTYADQPKGFTYGTNNENNDIIIYMKRSDELADWYDPITLRAGKDGENVALLEPMSFTKPTGADYFYFSMPNKSAVQVACVCIDTPDGELRLPYNSAYGVTKMLKKPDGAMHIYFGNLIPAFTTGKVYFSQGAVPTSEEPSEPETPVVLSSVMYGYIQDNTLTSIDNITYGMVVDAISNGTLHQTEVESLNRVSIKAPSGSFLIVLTTNNLVATKDDGNGTKTTFNTEISGANGDAIVLNDTNYKLYGEFRTNTSEVFIYVGNN